MAYSRTASILANRAVPSAFFPFSLNTSEGRQSLQRSSQGWQRQPQEREQLLSHLLWAIFKALSFPPQSRSHLRNAQHLSQGLTDFSFRKLHSGCCQKHKGEEVREAFSCWKFSFPFSRASQCAQASLSPPAAGAPGAERGPSGAPGGQGCRLLSCCLLLPWSLRSAAASSTGCLRSGTEKKELFSQSWIPKPCHLKKRGFLCALFNLLGAQVVQESDLISEFLSQTGWRA